MVGNGNVTQTPLDILHQSGVKRATRLHVQIAETMLHGISRRTMNTALQVAEFYRQYHHRIDTAAALVAGKPGERFRYPKLQRNQQLGAIIARAMISGMGRSDAEMLLDILRTGSYVRGSKSHSELCESICRFAATFETWRTDYRNRTDWHYAAIEMLVDCFRKQEPVPELKANPGVLRKAKGAKPKLVLCNSVAATLGVAADDVTGSYQYRIPLRAYT